MLLCNHSTCFGCARLRLERLAVYTFLPRLINDEEDFIIDIAEIVSFRNRQELC